MAKAGGIRGLSNFIAEIRDCKNMEEERLRVEKELAKIRGKFGQDRSLGIYHHKKYVWKLLYIYMLGFDVEFGHKQATDLIPVPRYADKQVGYVACSVLLNEDDEFLRLVVNSIRNDLLSRNEGFQCLALGFIGSVGGMEMAESLTHDIMKILTSGGQRAVVRKKAALCLLRLFRRMPPEFQIIQPETWCNQMINLLNETDLGLLLSSVTLLTGLVARDSKGYENVMPKVVQILEKIVLLGHQVVPDQYMYYRIPVPWLQSKCLRCLQYYEPPTDERLLHSVNEVVKAIISNALQQPVESKKKVQQSKDNATNAVLLEAIMLCLHYEIGQDLLQESVSMLGKFLTGKDPNTKYLALETMTRLALVPEILETVREHQDIIVTSLHDPDVSIRRKAMDLLFTMTDNSNAAEIVKELLKFLPVANYQLREDLVLKTAILAERFAPSVQWYIDAMLDMMELAGDQISEDIWHRVVQLVTNNESMQMYAAQNMVDALQRGSTHEALVSVATFVLGEFGSSLQNITPREIYQLLHEKFPLASPKLRGLMLTAYAKLVLAAPQDQQLRNEVNALLEKFKTNQDIDLQQRALEYQMLVIGMPSKSQLEIFQQMPKWPERESSLMKRLTKQIREQETGADDKYANQDDDEEEVARITYPEQSQQSVSIDNTLQVPHEAPNLLAQTPRAEPQTPMGQFNGGYLNQAGSDGLLDDGFGGQGAKSQQLQPQQSYGYQNGNANVNYGNQNSMVVYNQDDPFSASSQMSGSVSQTQQIKIEGSLDTWFRNLVLSNRGVVYEDTVLQIGLKMEYSGSFAQVHFFFGNKSAQESLTNFVFSVPHSPSFQVQQSPVQNMIGPQQQAQVTVQLCCTQPFLQPPRAQVSYSFAQQQVKQEISLPVVVTKYIQNDPYIDKQYFFSVWKGFAGPPNKQQQMVTRYHPLSVENLGAIMKGLNLGSEKGYLDPNVNNESGAGYFVFGLQGQEQKFMCQARVEGNPDGRKQFRVTATSENPTLASQIKDLLASQIQNFV